MSDKLVGIEAAAEMVGRTPHALYRLVARRQIPYRKAGRRLVFVESELREWIADLPGVSLEEVRERQAAGMA
jgi:predicted DNA-binding transcriptional regulator AlpA